MTLLLLACAAPTVAPEAPAEGVAAEAPQAHRLGVGDTLAGKTIGVENPITLPDPEGRFVVLEAIRSADWCPVCVGQVRRWEEQGPALDAAGAVLYVLTPDRPDALAAGIEKNELSATIIPVDKSLWAEWGITNPDKDKLPHPSTFVLDAEGTVVFAETNEDYNQRADPAKVLAALSAINAGGDSMLPAGAEPGVTQGPDWDGALQVSVSETEGGTNIHLDVREGFHVYGKKEEIAIPLHVTVDGRDDVQVAIPDGSRHEFTLGVVWILEDQVDLLVPVAPPASGTLDMQLCTDTACSPPVTMPWSVE